MVQLQKILNLAFLIEVAKLPAGIDIELETFSNGHATLCFRICDIFFVIVLIVPRETDHLAQSGEGNIMRYIILVAISYTMFGLNSPATASRINPREDIMKASTALDCVRDKQIRAEANLLIDRAEESLRDKNKYHAYLFAQKALNLMHGSQLQGKTC